MLYSRTLLVIYFPYSNVYLLSVLLNVYLLSVLHEVLSRYLLNEQRNEFHPAGALVFLAIRRITLDCHILYNDPLFPGLKL